MSAFTAKIQGWVYPTPTDTGATAEYSDGRTLYMLKPEYFTVNTSGVLVRLDTDVDNAFNGYSTANALLVKQKSSHQYITVSCNNWTTKGDVLCSDGTKRSNAISTLISTLDAIKFDGIELDFEPFGNFTLSAGQYTNYKTFITELGVALHAAGYKLMVCGPSVNDVDSPFLASLYRFKYDDVNSLPIDYIVNMAYDVMFNYNTDEDNSVQPVAFVDSTCDYMKATIKDIDKIVIGMPSYGYHATEGGDTSDGVLDTKDDSELRTGYDTAIENSDFELTWVNGGVRSFYQDAIGLSAKRDVIEAKGIKHISVWHLGGNDWFTGKTEPANRALAGSRTVSSARTVASARSVATRKLI